MRSGLMPFGREITIGLRVPPKCDAINFEYWNGVLPAPVTIVLSRMPRRSNSSTTRPACTSACSTNPAETSISRRWNGRCASGMLSQPGIKSARGVSLASPGSSTSASGARRALAERTDRGGLIGGRIMPLANRRRLVSVVTQHSRHGSGSPRNDAGTTIAIHRALSNVAIAGALMIAPGQQGRASWRADRGGVDPLALRFRGWTRIGHDPRLSAPH